MDKTLLLKQLEEECGAADLPLKKEATNLVFGKGNPYAEIVFVGEAAGKNEDLQGEPFVGAAGKNLDKLLEKVGLSMNEVYITNILKYRPPENRNPSFEEIRTHTPSLVRQIMIIKPKVICSLGNYATKFFLSGCNPDEMKSQPGITSLHGKARKVRIGGDEVNLIPLFHPAAIIYNQKLKVEWEKDMVVVKDFIRNL